MDKLGQLVLITADTELIIDSINKPNTKYFISYGSLNTDNDSGSDSEEKDSYEWPRLIWDYPIEIIPKFRKPEHLNGYMLGEGLSWENNRGFSYTFYEGNGIWSRYEGSEHAVKLFQTLGVS